MTYRLKCAAMFLTLCTTSVTHAQINTFSLNSSNPNINWQLAPREAVADSGDVVSRAGYAMNNHVPGIVPGVVFSSYVAAGKEPVPEYGDNIYKVDETFYNRPFWYRTEFDIPYNADTGRHVWLNFNNTNRFAEFYFNGVKISGTNSSTKDVSGHMLRSAFDVTRLVRKDGKNALAVLIYDADQRKKRDGKDPYGVACSPSYLAGAGWDWMPYVPGRLAGITGNAWVSVTGDAIMNDPWMRSYLPSNDRAELSFISEVRNLSDETRDITVKGIITPGNITFTKTITVPGNTSRHLHVDRRDTGSMLIDKPELWWPNGYGSPHLYTCKLECISNGVVTDTRTVTFGIRKYDYRIEMNSAGFPVLTLYINGRRIFAKGGNWGMSEYLLRCHGDDYEPKIRLHKEMNYNMIRLWTGCVTDDEFYDYCDRYGIMVWDDFWLYVAYNDVVQHDAFKNNARDKVRRLRNHPCIAVWCGANETHPVSDLDNALRMIVMEEDGNDRLYKSCSNQDAMSGSGWWKDLPPRHHFGTSASNLAFNKPAYPYGIDHGYGFRSEIGMATFPSFESVKLFIPKKSWWPLPSDEQLENDDENIWNRHFFGKEASNAGPTDYRKSVNSRYGESSGLEEFCEKAQLINLEDMKGMYEAWNDKMWNDATGLLIWMSHPAYPSFVWQTYDYYYDPTGAYWGAKSACEPRHIQWNCLDNNIRVVNSTAQELHGVTAEAHVYNLDGQEITALHRSATVDVEAGNTTRAFIMDFNSTTGLDKVHFLRLSLKDASGTVLSENFYWRSADNNLDYRALNSLPEARLSCTVDKAGLSDNGTFTVTLVNNTASVAFANRLRLVNKKNGKRILPVIMSDNYITMMPGERRRLTIEADPALMRDGVKVLIKQYLKPERTLTVIK